MGMSGEYGDGNTNTRIHLSNLQCTGSESEIYQCNGNEDPIGCTHDNDVSVECLRKYACVFLYKCHYYTKVCNLFKFMC